MNRATGWDNGLCQDYCRRLGTWFADRLGARQQLRNDMGNPMANPIQLKVSESNETELLQMAYRQVYNAADPKGRIDVLVDWQMSGTYVKAIEMIRGVKPACVYVRPGYGRIVSVVP